MLFIVFLDLCIKGYVLRLGFVILEYFIIRRCVKNFILFFLCFIYSLIVYCVFGFDKVD